jgi:hypothetical protein
MNTSDFHHTMAAHCETGTMMGLLRHSGLSLSESMVFGISGGIFFAYLQSPKLPFPTFVPRTRPGDIRLKIKKRLAIDYTEVKFRDPQKARQKLDALLAEKIPVAVQVDMFYMEYIPSYMKVHFNGHFIIAVGMENDTYTVSDCYYPDLVDLSADAMQTARFSKGDLAPHGLLYHISRAPENIDLRAPIIRGIKEACGNMVKLPVPFIGVKGIRLFARKLLDWPKLARDEEHLSHEIMMISTGLEDRGTGGAGFRFMYATFLQEASKILNNPALAEMAVRMMQNGDKWREISLHAARIGKNKDLGPLRLKELQEMILARADAEEHFFRELLTIIKQ